MATPASSSRSPDNGSAYTVTLESSERTRGRSAGARPPRMMSGLRIDKRLVELHVDMPRAVHAEQVHLLDRLWRAGAAKPRGTIGGDHEERQTGVMRFHQCGQQLRGGGARGRHDGDGG